MDLNCFFCFGERHNLTLVRWEAASMGRLRLPCASGAGQKGRVSPHGRARFYSCAKLQISHALPDDPLRPIWRAIKVQTPLA